MNRSRDARHREGPNAAVLGVIRAKCLLVWSRDVTGVLVASWGSGRVALDMPADHHLADERGVGLSGSSPWSGSQEGRARPSKQGCRHGSNRRRGGPSDMDVMIGIDPHKRSHTATMLDRRQRELRQITVRSGSRQLVELLAWANGARRRTWAVESASGLGYLLAQQLVAAGETVVDVPATLASRARLLSTGRSNKNDPNDALSVAVAALRSPDLRRVEAVGHSEVLRLLAKRNIDIGNQRSRVVCRVHSLLAELAGGGIAKEIN